MTRAFLIAITMLVSIQSLHAATVIFESNAVISAVDTYDTVVVKGDDTVVTMTGGTVNKVITMNAAVFNLSGGSVTTITSHDLSVLDSSGNAVMGDVFSNGNSSVYLSGDVLVSSFVHVRNAGKVYISENSHITWLYFYNGFVDAMGGNIDYMHLGTGAAPGTVKLSGGNIGKIDTDIMQGAVKSNVAVIGYDITAVPYGGPDGEGQVIGNWNDDSAFSIDLGQFAYDHLVIYDGVIPPDCAFQPGSDLSGDCVVNMVDLAQMAAEWLDDGRQ